MRKIATRAPRHYIQIPLFFSYDILRPLAFSRVSCLEGGGDDDDKQSNLGPGSQGTSQWLVIDMQMMSFLEADSSGLAALDESHEGAQKLEKFMAIPLAFCRLFL